MTSLSGSIGQILLFLLQIYSWMIIGRIIISWVNPDPRNPIVQFLYRVTEPVMAPFRRMLPSFGGIDFSPILVFVAIMIAQKVVAALFLGPGLSMGTASMLFRELLTVVHLLVTLYMVVLLIRAGISLYVWLSFRQGRRTGNLLQQPGALFIFKATEPVIRPIRERIPAVGGLDLSPIIVALVLAILLGVIQDLANGAPIFGGVFSGMGSMGGGGGEPTIPDFR